MGDEERSTSVRYVKFSGRGSDFNEWKIKTLSLARRKKFDVYLLEDGSKSTDNDVVDNYVNGNADAWGSTGTEPQWDGVQCDPGS